VRLAYESMTGRAPRLNFAIRAAAVRADDDGVQQFGSVDITSRARIPPHPR